MKTLSIATSNPYLLTQLRVRIFGRKNEMKEIWKDIKGYEGLYKVSNTGKVLSVKRYGTRGLLLKFRKYMNYYIVGLTKNGKHTKHRVHRLVANAFIKNPNNKKVVNHLDGNGLNNYVNNLEWCTPSENQKHAYRIGLRKPTSGEKNYFSKLTEKQVLEIRNDYSPVKKNKKYLTRKYKISIGHIEKIISRKRWKHI